MILPRLFCLALSKTCGELISLILNRFAFGDPTSSMYLAAVSTTLSLLCFGYLFWVPVFKTGGGKPEFRTFKYEGIQPLRPLGGATTQSHYSKQYSTLLDVTDNHPI